ncbi:NADP-dependent oxidoreductase domain-containing protein [Xylariaceae sp. FL0255]|nr:NADP-dependent oxidoreductase domain-containing protein [Xylariaceae sp. FL0255]
MGLKRLYQEEPCKVVNEKKFMSLITKNILAYHSPQHQHTSVTSEYVKSMLHHSLWNDFVRLLSRSDTGRPSFASKFLDSVRSTGINQIDSAARYLSDNHGGSERLLGTVHAGDKGFKINTKVLFSGNTSDGTLQLEAGRKITPLEEQAKGAERADAFGTLREVNMVERFLNICEGKGYPKPSVYQGQYNLICRGPEKELIPLLRKHNMTFNAYSPLGGGFLPGKLMTGNTAGTRLVALTGAHFHN